MARSNLEGALVRNVRFGAPAAGTSAGFSGMLRIPTATVAATGTNQATAAALTDGFTLVTAADATKAVRLPPAEPGLVVIIKNNVALALPVFPAVGDAINAGAANAAYTMAASVSLLLVAYDATTWYSVPLLGS